MNAMRIAGIILLVLGIAGFLTGGFSFNKETTQAQIGPLKIQVQEKEQINVPQWLSIAAAVAGGLLLGMSFRKS